MKAIMLSVQPQWVEKILNGEKTIEIRKTKPSYKLPIKVYIYCTYGRDLVQATINPPYTINPEDMDKPVKITKLNGRVVAEFTLNKVEPFTTDYRRDGEQTTRISKESCVDFIDLMEYEKNSPCLYAWHIDKLKLYEEPKMLKEFNYACPRKYLLKELCYKEHDGKLDYCKYNDKDNGVCQSSISCPPQSWCYVDELGV